MEGRSTQMVQRSGSCADRNELCTNAGRPRHRDQQITVVHELRQCELAQKNYQLIHGLLRSKNDNFLITAITLSTANQLS